ncbi:hypothetical protein CALCODRAFT_298826 [Calocera cornea HHB12733]|uniref:Phosphatidylglycerol/phosphatidylinositol transfer protein n=1 Tax=Calocera cornea HHB12733 TaxID=1353952 RepID=A0A165FJG6_9BASI|nr:hypothetical protein CALCODRAFT_298826 [Calocera cornea HHB12733]
MFGLVLLATGALAVLARAASVPQLTLGTGVETAQASKFSWYDCSEDDYSMEVMDVTVSPDPPQRGKDLYVEVIANAGSEITVDVQVGRGRIRILRRTYDFCDEAQRLKTSEHCPAKKGAHRITATVKVPETIPPALFNVEAYGYTELDDDLLCMGFTVDFSKALRALDN